MKYFCLILNGTSLSSTQPKHWIYLENLWALFSCRIMDKPRPLFWLFLVFSNKSMWKMSCPSNIWCRDLNPWPLQHEWSPITTRARLPPILHSLWISDDHAYLDVVHSIHLCVYFAFWIVFTFVRARLFCVNCNLVRSNSGKHFGNNQCEQKKIAKCL